MLFIMEHGQCPQDSGQAPPGDEHCRQNPGWGECGVRGQQPPLTPVTTGSPSSSGHFPNMLGARPGQGSQSGATPPRACPSAPRLRGAHTQPSFRGQALSPLLSQCSPAHPHFLPTSQNAHTNCCLQTYCWLCLQVLGPSPLNPAGASPQLRSHLQEALLDVRALVPFPRPPACPCSLAGRHVTPQQPSPGPLPAASMSRKHASKALGRNGAVF